MWYFVEVIFVRMWNITTWRPYFILFNFPFYCQIERNVFNSHVKLSNKAEYKYRCPRRKGPNFWRVFLRSNYNDITQNTYIQSSMVTEILARKV